MKRILFAMLLCCSLVSLFPQNKMTLDNAINDFVVDFTSKLSTSQFSGKKSIAVIAFESDKQSLVDYFFRTMAEELVEKGGEVYERRRIENLSKEIDFSLTGYISDETAQRIGHFVGADTVVYGSFSSIENVNAGNEYRMTITGAITETAQIVSQRNYDLREDSMLDGLLGITGNVARLWTVGASVGSSFSRPLVIGTLHGTIAPFRYSFLEIGVDAGFLSRVVDEGYYAICPFAHYAFFWPFDKGGLYVGAGVGYMFGTISHPDEKEPIRIIAADGVIGANIMDMLDISYTLRTTFSNFTNKFSVGYTYRFK